MQKAGILAWALGSAALMVVGAFGPWVTALGVLSMNGWDIERRQAGVLIIIAVLGAFAVFTRRSTTSGGTWAMIAGLAGLALTFYEHHHITSTISGINPAYQSLTSALVHVGWGLNAALVASISLTLSGFASFFFEPDTRRATSTPAAAYDPNVPTIPAGWYRDPNDEALLRYWNGFGWTTQTAKPAS